MARPKLDPTARKISVMVAPPPDLDPERRALWDREFARFPPGYFVPSDVRGMLLYLDAVAAYDRAKLRLEVAEESQAPKGLGALRKECREALLIVHRLQRDLRMYPATRTHREIHGTLANDPTNQSAQPNQPEGWRGLFAVPNGSDIPPRAKGKK